MTLVRRKTQGPQERSYRRLSQGLTFSQTHRWGRRTLGNSLPFPSPARPEYSSGTATSPTIFGKRQPLLGFCLQLSGKRADSNESGPLGLSTTLSGPNSGDASYSVVEPQSLG